MNEKITLRSDLTFTDLPPGMPNVLLTDDHGSFWLATADNLAAAAPVSLSAALDWVLEAYPLSNESPIWPGALMGRAAKELAEIGK